MSARNRQVAADEVDPGHGQVGAASGGQSGDTQGLSPAAAEAEESVEELAETGQDFQAGLVEGMEDAADHPEKPMIPREDQRRPADEEPARRTD